VEERHDGQVANLLNGGASCEYRRGPDRDRALKALILSPLLNLTQGLPGGPTIVQHVKLRSSRGDPIAAVATLSLAPDGRTLTVTLDDRDGQQSVGVQLRRLGPVASTASGFADADLQALELTRRTPGPRPFTFTTEVSLGEAGLRPFLSPADHAPMSLSAVAAVRADAISGLPGSSPDAAAAPRFAPQEQPVHSPRGLRYLERRLTDELTAAVTATLPVATSRHVELATLYARSIQALKEAPAATAGRW